MTPSWIAWKKASLANRTLFAHQFGEAGGKLVIYMGWCFDLA